MKAVFTLKSAESRRLLAKAVAAMDEVKKAKENAYIILAGGTTNGIVAQEILETKDIEPQRGTVGISTNGVLCITHPDSRKPFPAVLYKGQPVEKTITDALNDFHLDTVVIKGANAVDLEGNVGVITAGFDGGTIPKIIGTVTSTGLKYITPVSLEKLVPSVKEAAKVVGARRIDQSLGADFGMFCITNSQVITEIEALKILFGVKATHIASGGVGGNEGSVVLAVEGSEEEIEKTVSFIENEIKGEPPIPANKGKCDDCRYLRCRYNGRKAEDLPEWLR
ncbi:MAG: hypothetical protein ACOWWO_05900 [Peptococcaceae bacterium]